MKANLKATVITTALMALMLGSNTWAGQDPTKYDCRVVVGYRTEFIGKGHIARQVPILACPHKDKMAAGQCESSWLYGMRCKS